MIKKTPKDKLILINVFSCDDKRLKKIAHRITTDLNRGYLMTVDLSKISNDKMEILIKLIKRHESYGN